MMTCSQTRIAELETRIAELEKENEKLKEKTKEYEAVECFIMKTWRSSNYDFYVALPAHYREGKVIDGEWVNDNFFEDDDEDEDEEEEEDEDEAEDKDKDKHKKDGNEFFEHLAGIINEVYRQQEEGQLLSQ